MLHLFRREKSAAEHHDPQILLADAQAGDRLAREQLISDYRPYILKIAAQVSGRYLIEGESDEYSISLIAFDEAINSFDPKKGIAFLTFAETVIRRRLIDFFRKESKSRQVVPFSSFGDDLEDEQNVINLVEAQRARDNFQLESEISERQEEIARYNELLQQFGVTFAELVDLSPKHEDARRRAMEVAKLIAINPQYCSYMLTKKELPLKFLAREVSLSRKTLERQRKYIIAITLIIINDFSYLKGYIAKCF